MTPDRPGPPDVHLILGTAGHIDHGKTALVRALTGVDTDRLKEEKERGITIDLGFAEFAPDAAVRFGIVDVPGHEGFVRNMVAGATGVDVVLLVVAADEGVMPQTREHLAIAELVGARSLVVAITKSDLVEEAWLDLVREEVREHLEGGPFQTAPLVTTSAVSGAGLEELTRVLLEEARATGPRPDDDLARLPVDRVFTIRGTGTVATGTLWSGRLRSGDTVRLLPAGGEARIRGIQVHGREVDEAVAGERTAVALAGAEAAGRGRIGRGTVAVVDPGWRATHMLTVRLRCLVGTGWTVTHGQRVRVHLGTAEVLARVASLESEEIPPGEQAWAQLRLEAPLVARSRDRFVVRSYSPVTTIAGGQVAEPLPPKRSSLDGTQRALLDRLLREEAEGRLESALNLTGWSGADAAELPIRAGLSPSATDRALTALREAGGAAGAAVIFGSGPVEEGRRRLVDAVSAFHRAEPLRPGLPLERLRQTLPGERARDHLAQPLIEALAESGELEVEGDVARRPGFTPRPDEDQARVRDRLVALYREAGLSPPALRDLPDDLAAREDLSALLDLLLEEGHVVRLDDEFLAWRETVDRAARDVERVFGGRAGLGPADFREVLPVSRKHLIPLLNHLDTRGVTVRTGEGREVPGDA